MNGVSVKGKFAIFSPGALHLLVMETALEYKNNDRSNIQEKGEKKTQKIFSKSLSCRELGLCETLLTIFWFLRFDFVSQSELPAILVTIFDSVLISFYS